ncbi:Lipase chaperone LimK [Marinobacter daqiaonensis]|uniref:Lipase chaperone n=1 Tax=Marinobacter daqiaonensis TaxID=650891 RepID=A0A1I6JVW9_9GAMM|nr:lipase secretion chaperone [Marinobacter daqiaonensis]SFR83093.1 Lipase chaperone LimK [Marinobacter daqiaonensis]
MLHQYVRAGLAGETGRQAARLLGNYVGYRQALEQAEAQWMAEQPLAPGEKLERTIALRRQHLGPLTSSQLFAGEDAHQRFLIAREEVRANRDLSNDQRQAALSRLKENLRSGALLVNSKGTSAPEDLRNARENWRKLGLSEATRLQLEQQTLGLVAARDLTGSNSWDWQQRYDHFKKERNLVLRAGLSEEEKQRQIDTLLVPTSIATNWTPSPTGSPSICGQASASARPG